MAPYKDPVFTRDRSEISTAEISTAGSGDGISESELSVLTSRSEVSGEKPRSPVFRFGLFGLVGVSVMALGAGVLYVETEVLGAPLWLAYLTQAVMTITVSFLHTRD